MNKSIYIAALATLVLACSDSEKPKQYSSQSPRSETRTENSAQINYNQNSPAQSQTVPQDESRVVIHSSSGDAYYSRYSGQHADLDSLLDDNWNYYERENWMFFPYGNFAINKNFESCEQRKGSTQYLVAKFKLRAMNNNSEPVPYQLAVSGKTSSFKGSCANHEEYLRFYAELNGITYQEALEQRTIIGSAANLAKAISVPFPIGDVSLAWHIPTDSGMIHRYRMGYHFQQGDLLFLHSTNIRDNSFQFCTVKGKDYEWEEFERTK
jgi:hypothetical protein